MAKTIQRTISFLGGLSSLGNITTQGVFSTPNGTSTQWNNLVTVVSSNSGTWGAGGGGGGSSEWSAITNKPTTLAGYGITDAASTSYVSNNYVPLSGGTVTGSLSVLGEVTYIETSVVVTSAMYIDTTSSEAALRVTQNGSGDAIRVEDSSNPDSTPFIVKADGNVGVGTTDPGAKLTIVGDVSADTFKVNSTTINSLTSTSYTLQTSDNGKVITLNNANAITVGVPSGLGTGFSVSLIQLGAGQVTLSAGAGVTLNSYLGYTKLAGQHAGATLFAYSANVLNLNGALA